MTRVVLVHGTRDTAASFDAVVKLLDDLDVVTYTRRGWEHPSATAPPVSVGEHIDDLIEVLDGKPSVVVGHSWGGRVAIGAAIRQPDLVRSVGFWETAMLWFPGWPAKHADILSGAMDRVRQKLDESHPRHGERMLFLAEASESFKQHWNLEDLTVPCLVGVGGNSLPVFAQGTRLVADTMGFEVFEIEEADHMAHRDHPEAFARFVRRAIALTG